ACFVGAKQVPVVLVPRVEARQEEFEPRSCDLPEHAGPDPKVPKKPCPGRGSGDAVLTHELERAGSPVDHEIASDVEHHLGLHLPPLRTRPMARRVEPGIVCNALVLDFLRGMPAPQVRTFLLRPGKMAGIGEKLMGEDCRKMLER